MSTLNYLVKGQKYYSNILIRFKNGRKFDYTTSTDFKIDPKNWSTSKQKIKNTAGDKTKDIINNHLSELKKFILDEFNLDNATGVYIDKQWLQQKVANHFNRPLNEDVADDIYFVPYTDTYIKKAPTRLIKGNSKPVSPLTIKKYTGLMNKLKAYEEYAKTKIKFTDLNLIFYDNFVEFLRIKETSSTNTVGKYISTLKAIARDALLKGLPVNKEINHPNFFVPSEKSKDIYLNDAEINTIYNHSFKGNDKLDNARDLFIIGLRTGLRVSDFLRLKQTNIKGGYIEIETQKTGQQVVIPMHHQVKEILKKRGGFPKQISDQKFNLYIKDVCQDAKLTQKVQGSKIDKETNRKKEGVYPKYELVSSHICRRSFATNLYGELTNMSIMGITGHTTETQFLKYIKITPKEHAKSLKEYWRKQEILKAKKEVKENI